MIESEDQSLPAEKDEPPPFLGRWQRVYTAVVCYLFVLIAVLYVVSRFFVY